jgi:hypothetical protein
LETNVLPFKLFSQKKAAIEKKTTQKVLKMETTRTLGSKVFGVKKKTNSFLCSSLHTFLLMT